MGKKKRDEMVSESGGSEAIVETNKRPRKEAPKSETNASKPKKVNNNASEKVKSASGKVSGEPMKPLLTSTPTLNKIPKGQNIYTDTSSASDSESEKQSNKNENENEKKSGSDSDSDSDSDSSDSDSSPTSREEPDKGGSKEKTVKSTETANQVNSLTNLMPAKSFVPSPMSSSSDSYHSDTEEEDKKRRKKQKKMMQMQLVKRVRKNTAAVVPPPKTTDVKPDVPSDMEEDGVDNGAINDDLPEWPESDYAELLRRMEAQIPARDNQKFDSRAAKLDWSKVAFNNYTPEECMEVWLAISKRIRRYRTLAEILQDAREWVTKPWTNFYRGVKKNRHPDMPNKPLSTYMIYYLEHKDKVVKENPGLEMTQISKIISEMYKNLSSEERERYTEMAAQQRLDFDQKLTEFYKEHPDLHVLHQQQKLQNKTGKDLLTKGPRKASNPFKLFFQDQLKQHPGNPGKDKKALEEDAKEKWRNLSDKKKLVWIEWALEDHKRYEDEMKAYRMEHPDYVPPITYKSILTKDEKNIRERLAGKPVKPPNSAYSLFSRVMLQSDPDVKALPPKQRMAEISKKWKELTDAQKSHYEAKVRAMQDVYKLEFASYLEGLSPAEREEELRKSQPKRKPPKVEEKVKKKELKKSNTGNKTTNKDPELSKLNLFKGEPEPPPVRVFDVFLQSFQSEKTRSGTEEEQLKEALKSWNSLTEAKKEAFRKKHEELKQKYIKDFEIFLKSLSPEELKEFSVMKELAKKNKEAKDQRELINGSAGDSNEESDDEENGSSSDSDSDDSDSGKSSKSSSSSEDSE